jgi:hypothetical protein
MPEDDKQPVEEPTAEAAVEAEILQEPEVSPEPEPTPEPETQVSLASKLGLEGFDGLSDDEALARLRDGYTRHSQLEQQVEHMRGYADIGQKYLAEQYNKPSEPEPTPEPKDEGPWYREALPYLQRDPVWDSFLERDEAGNEVFKSSTPAEIQRDYLAYQQGMRDNLQKLGTNPGEFFDPIIAEAERRAEVKAREVYENLYREREQETFIDQFAEQHDGWLWARDASGQKIPDGYGNYVPSELGTRFDELVRYAASGLGVNGAQQRAEVATKLLNLEILQQGIGPAEVAEVTETPVAEEPPPPPAEEKKMNVLKRNRRLAKQNPGRGGSEPAASSTESQNPSLSFRDKLRAKLASEK